MGELIDMRVFFEIERESRVTDQQEGKPRRVRPVKTHLVSEFNENCATCSIHIRAPLTSDPDEVTCRICRQHLPPGLPKERG